MLFVKIFTLMMCLMVSSNFNLTDVNFIDKNNTKVYITGNGIATRLHKPVLEEIPGVSTEFVRIPEDKIDDSDLIVKSDDWLFLGTPVYKHKNHLINSTKTYSKILCEKPVGLSLNDIAEIKSAINKNDTLFRVDYALRFLPVMQEISNFIEDNEVKSVLIKCNADFNINPSSKEWKNDYKLGGGVLYSIFPHFVDLIYYLNCEPQLDSIDFESTTEVPMDDIKFICKSNKGYDVSIDIDLCRNFDELVLEVQTINETKKFDLVNTTENLIEDSKYLNGTLSATSEISPWRISFKSLVRNLLYNPDDYRLARIDDAENVHKVLDTILANA